MRKFTLLFALLLAFVGMAKAQNVSDELYKTTPGVEYKVSETGGTQYFYYLRNSQFTSFLGAYSLGLMSPDVSSAKKYCIMASSNGFTIHLVNDDGTTSNQKIQAVGPRKLWVTDNNPYATYDFTFEKVDAEGSISYLLKAVNSNTRDLKAPSANDDSGDGYYGTASASDKAYVWQFIPANDAAKEAAGWPKVTMLPGDATHGNLTTFSSTKDVVCPNDYQVFKATYAENSLNLEEVADRVIPANTGVILKGSEGSFFMVPNATENTLTSALTPTGGEGKLVNEGENIYGLGLLDGTLGFYKVNKNTTIGAGKAYLASSQGGSAIALNFGGTTTGVHSVSASTENHAPVFDLSGRRVQSVVKGGVYIQNGKKFIK